MILEKRYKIELEAKEPLRIGGAIDPRSGIENPVAKLGDKVVIPGPSLKGALRAEMEQFLIETYYDKASKSWDKDKLAFQPCIPSDERKVTRDEKLLIELGKFRRGGACHYPTRREEPEPNSICPICYFLGAMGLPGFVRIPFLRTETVSEELYSLRIDRATNKGVDGTNRPYELVSQGAKFGGELVVIFEDPLTGWKIGEPRLLKERTLGDQWLQQETRPASELVNIYIIERLKNIKIIGGYKSKGLGQVKINVIPL